MKHQGFLIIEEFLWPNRFALDEATVVARTREGLKYREAFFKQNGLMYVALKDNGDSKGIMILNGDYSLLQKYMHEDPLYGVVDRAITPIFEGSISTVYEGLEERCDLSARLERLGREGGDALANFAFGTGSLASGANIQEITPKIVEKLNGCNTNY